MIVSHDLLSVCGVVTSYNVPLCHMTVELHVVATNFIPRPSSGYSAKLDVLEVQCIQDCGIDWSGNETRDVPTLVSGGRPNHHSATFNHHSATFNHHSSWLYTIIKS